MHRVAFQIVFTNSEVAADADESFPPDDLPYVESRVRKRDGDSQFILLELTDSSDEAQFRQLCSDFVGIIDVREITEDECRKHCRYNGGTAR